MTIVCHRLNDQHGRRYFPATGGTGSGRIERSPQRGRIGAPLLLPDITEQSFQLRGLIVHKFDSLIHPADVLPLYRGCTVRALSAGLHSITTSFATQKAPASPERVWGPVVLRQSAGIKPLAARVARSSFCSSSAAAAGTRPLPHSPAVAAVIFCFASSR